MSEPIVYNIRGKRPDLMANNVPVDRGSPWGNPFIMNNEAERDDACDKYELYARWRLTIEPDWLKLLRGKNLGCWCAPKRCHAETLLRLANGPAHE